MQESDGRMNWLPPSLPPGVPMYRAIADAIADDVTGGALKPGTRMPTHRSLAATLGVDLTTITRAYNEAQVRGLLSASVGRGTFVIDPASRPPALPVEVDLSMIVPPMPPEMGMPARLARALSAVARRPDLIDLLRYQSAGGSMADRQAGAVWLSPLLHGIIADRVLVTGGAQTALTALFSLHLRPEDAVMADPFTYPGLLAAASARGLTVEPVPGDEQGMTAERLDQVASSTGARFVYLTPTLQNPTGRTLSLERRHAIIEVARRRELTVIEDDAYGMLPAVPVPPLAALAPERVFYISTLSKVLTPGLRVAYLVPPTGDDPGPLRAHLRAISQMAPPVTVAVATGWIMDGSAQIMLAAIRHEAAARMDIARNLLPEAYGPDGADGHHLWLTLPPAWGEDRFIREARHAGALLVPGSSFAVDPQKPSRHARVALGAAPDRALLSTALQKVAALLLRGPPGLREMV